MIKNEKSARAAGGSQRSVRLAGVAAAGCMVLLGSLYAGSADAAWD